MMAANGSWFIEALFLLSAFLLRLWDRRRTLRGWSGHLRMRPRRHVLWLVATVAGGWPALEAALLGELLLYPLMVRPIARLPRGGLLALMILLGAVVEGLTRVGCAPAPLRYAALFVSGTMLGAFWLRGPDGEPRAALLAGGGAGMFSAIGWFLPASLSWSVPAASACLLLTLAHGATLRRAPLHWRGHGVATLATGVKRRWFRAASRPV
ncbi:MAG: hypothetical protein QHC40_14740 [Sphingobium sp.]|nr:hypothetical protein [Sphingobium sp.]